MQRAKGLVLKLAQLRTRSGPGHSGAKLPEVVEEQARGRNGPPTPQLYGRDGCLDAFQAICSQMSTT